MSFIGLSQNILNQNLEMVDDKTARLNVTDVVQFIKNVDVQVDIMDGDVMGAFVPGSTLRSVNISGTVQNITVAEHLPLLLHRETQIPLMSITFITSTASSTTSEGLLQYNEMTLQIIKQNIVACIKKG